MVPPLALKLKTLPAMELGPALMELLLEQFLMDAMTLELALLLNFLEEFQSQTMPVLLKGVVLVLASRCHKMEVVIPVLGTALLVGIQCHLALPAQVLGLACF